MTVAERTRGAFDGAVGTNGRIDVKVLARELDLPMATIAPALGLSVRALNANPTSFKAQAKAAKLLAAMNELAVNLLAKRYAILWLKTPQTAFGNRTAADWLHEGDLDTVCAEIRSFIMNEPD